MVVLGYFYTFSIENGVLTVGTRETYAKDWSFDEGVYVVGTEAHLTYAWGFYVIEPVPAVFTNYTYGYTEFGVILGQYYFTDVLYSDDEVVQIPVTTSGYFEITGSGIFPVSDEVATCFLEGTLIATPDGARAVEDLAMGDFVLTASGAALPVRWIGRQTVATRLAAPESAWPVRVAAGALGQGLPRRDLFVSPTHALLVEGVLVQARVLANGATIVQVRPDGERFTYYHLEFERHAVILAEGTPTESFVDSNQSRRRFDNCGEFEALYGADAAVAEPCDIPRVTASRLLPRRLKAKLAAWAGTPPAGRV